MKKLLSLCINLLLLIITDAVPLQLIAGDRTVVKKDGATHTISKYYVVPNDFNQNNVTNSTEPSQKTTARMNHRSIYSKSMDADTASEDQVSEKKNEAANDENNENNADANNTEVNLRSDLNDAQVDVATQSNNNTAESTESVNTARSLDADDDLGNLQVEPIANFININSSVTINEINVYNSSEELQSETSLISENATQTFEKDVEDELDDLILKKFGIAVQESSVQNVESFWKLIKFNIDKISDADELMAKVERLSLLLNIFTNLYEAAQSQKPIESMIDRIIDILEIPFVSKSNSSESQSQTDVSGDYDEECLRRCGLKRSKPQLDSNGTYLSENESLGASDNLELNKLDLQRRLRGDSDNDWVNTSNDPLSNQVSVSNQPTNILRSPLLVPNNLNVGVPDGYNVRSSILTPTLDYVVRNNDNDTENPKSNQTVPDSAETGETTDDQPVTIESRMSDDWPRTIKDTSTQNIPWSIQTITADDPPWHIEDKTTDNFPWHIEDKSIDNHPFNIEHKTAHTLPWTIGHKGTKKVPWNVQNRADPNWTIENKIGHSPITMYESRDPSVITHDGKILLQPNRPMSGTVHSIKNGVKKPYHIYTYVINPATSLYEIPNSENIFTVKSRQSNVNLGTTSNDENKIVYTNKPSYYESQFSLSKPSIDISRPSNSQLKYTNDVTSTYDTSNEVNPSDLLSGTTQDDNQPKYLVGHEHVLVGNIYPSDSETNSDEENDAPMVPEANSHPGVLLPNVPSNSFESLINLDNTRPVFTASTSASADTSNVNSDIGDTEPNPYNPNIFIKQTDLYPSVISKTSSYSDYDERSPVYDGHTDKHPGLISTSSSSSAYTNLPDQYDEPVYGGQIHQRPNLITTSASSNSEYTNLPDEYDEPVNDVQTHQHPGLISSSASSNSEYTNLPDEYVEPSSVYGGHTDKHPGLISVSSSSSAYTNLPDQHDEPVYGGQIHQRPNLITTSASSNSEYTNIPDEYDEPVYDVQTHQHPGLISSKYTNVLDNYDEPNLVYGGQTHKYPGFISKPSAHSKYTNQPNDYNNPISDYGQQTDTHPGQITQVNHYPEYANLDDYYDKPIPVNGGEKHKLPSFLSKASSHSDYSNLPNHYNNPTDDYEETDRYPVHIQIPVSGRPSENEDNLLLSYHPYGHTVHIIQPNLIAHLNGNQPTGLNYLKQLNLKLAPTYRLFTLDNLLKLRDVVTKTIEVNEPDVYDNRALMNLRKIINLILILAEHLEEPEGNIEWYEKIFYNTQKNRHPLEIYVYNLIRQRWLHELMLVLYKNDFNFNILQNPRIFSFLGSWQFPPHVLKFIKVEELIQHNVDEPEGFDDTFSTQNGFQDKFATHTYDDLLEEVPEDLENYVTNNVINSYKTPNAGIVLSIAGVEAEPDANSIIHILQKYLYNKSFIEKQENVIIRDNKVEMLKQIILFLREKGYNANIIADLIRKLYTAVYSTEGKGCDTHHTNFAKNMYDVILPVLRRSAR